MSGAIRVLKRHWRVFVRTWRHNLMYNVAEPLLYLAAMGFGLGALVQQIDGMTYLQFLAPGMVALSRNVFSNFRMHLWNLSSPLLSEDAAGDPGRAGHSAGYRARRTAIWNFQKRSVRHRDPSGCGPIRPDPFADSAGSSRSSFFSRELCFDPGPSLILAPSKT